MVNIASKASYFLKGCVRRITSKHACPCCGQREFQVEDRKFPYLLFSCGRCAVLTRFPSETPAEIEAFYQKEYTQKGLTTDLPGDKELSELIRSGFSGSEMDGSAFIAIFEALGLAAGSRIFDYGANWGYMTYQFAKHGYNASAFEISEPRAAFGGKLGIEIATRVNHPPASFDVVFSSHVLEHVRNPLAVLHEQLDLVRPGGFVVCVTPNGSAARKLRDPEGFHRHWGRVHPVLLSAEFVVANFPDRGSFVASSRDAAEIGMWDRHSIAKSDVSESELLIILKK